jgi:hypothetical protein
MTRVRSPYGVGIAACKQAGTSPPKHQRESCAVVLWSRPCVVKLYERRVFGLTFPRAFGL